MGRIGAEAAAAGDQVGWRRSAHAAVDGFGAHFPQHGLGLLRQDLAHRQVVGVITHPHPRHRRSPLVLHVAVEADEAVVGGQPVAEHFIAQGAAPGEAGVQAAFQRAAPDELAVVVPLEGVGAADGVGVAKQEVGGAALDAAETGMIDHIAVLQAPVDEGAALAQGRRVVWRQTGIAKGALAAAAGGEQQVAAHLAAVVAEAVGMFGAGRGQQQARGLDGLAGDHEDPGAHPMPLALPVDVFDRAHLSPRIRDQAGDLGVGPDPAVAGGHGLIQQGGAGRALGAGAAAVAAAVDGIGAALPVVGGLGEDGARRGQGVKSEPFAGRVDPLADDVLGQGRMGKVGRGARFEEGVFHHPPGNPHHLFHQGVPGFEFFVGDGPVGHVGAFDGAEFAAQAEVHRLEPVEVTAHEVGGAAHHVAVPEVPARLGGGRGVPAAVDRFLDHVLFVAQIRRVDLAPAAGQFVLAEVLLGEPGALFQHQHVVSGAGQHPGHRRGARAAAHDHHVVVAVHRVRIRSKVLAAVGRGKPGSCSSQRQPMPPGLPP